MCANNHVFRGNGAAYLFLSFDVEIVSDNAKTHKSPSRTTVAPPSQRRGSCRWASSCLDSSTMSPPVPKSLEQGRTSLHAPIRPPKRSSSPTDKEEPHGSLAKLHIREPRLNTSMLELPTISSSPPKKLYSQGSFPPKLPPRSSSNTLVAMSS